MHLGNGDMENRDVKMVVYQNR